MRASLQSTAQGRCDGWDCNKVYIWGDVLCDYVSGRLLGYEWERPYRALHRGTVMGGTVTE